MSRTGGWAMRAGDSWVVRTAVAYGLRGGRCTRGLLPFVRCWGRMEACGICIPAQAENLPPDACGGSPPDRSAPSRPMLHRAPCRTRPYRRRVYRMRIGPHTREASGVCSRADDQAALWSCRKVERGLLWRFVQIRFARAEGCSPLKPWSR